MLHLGHPAFQPRRYAPLVLSCDLSFKDGKDNDACGFALLGLLEPQRHLAVEARRQGLALATNAAGAQRTRQQPIEGSNAPDPWAELQIEALWAQRQRLDLPGVIKFLLASLNSLERQGLRPHAVLIEDAANGPAVCQLLRRQVPGLIAITPKGSKASRAHAVAPLVEAGQVRFARKADALYILGDLFEAWIGDDDPNPLHRQMAAAIKAVSDSGVPCYFIHGNRDFLLGKRFARESGMTLLPEEKVLELYGRRVLIMHGDTLCTDDAGYQAFRAKVHKPWLQMLFLALPLFVRKRIAARMRANSKEANSSKSLAIMDVNQNAVVSAMEKHQVQWLIHGHTHRPAVHELIANQQPAFRVVLGAWHTEGSMVKVTADDVELIHFPF